MLNLSLSLSILLSFIIGNSNASKSLPSGIDVQEYKHLGKNILNFDEINEKFEDSIVHYGKVKRKSIFFYLKTLFLC